MIFLYLLTALSLYFAFKGYKNKFFQNDNLWAETELIEPKKLINKTDWWKQSKIINALTQPGWFVKTFTTKRLIFQLSRQTIQFSPEQLWRLKQGAFSVAGILFIAWLWFGDFTIKDLWLYLGMWLLVTFMPDLYALQKLTKQNQRISADVPSFLDLLTLTLKSGVNLERALLLTTQNFASPLSTIVAEKLKELDCDPYIMIYNKPKCDKKYNHLQRFVNNKFIFWGNQTVEDYLHKRGYSNKEV